MVERQSQMRPWKKVPLGGIKARPSSPPCDCLRSSGKPEGKLCLRGLESSHRGGGFRGRKEQPGAVCGGSRKKSWASSSSSALYWR